MLLKEKKLNLLGQGLLLLATLIWGSTFIILKDTLDSLPVMLVLAVRFLTSALILLAVFRKRIKKMTGKTFLIGLTLGGVLSAAYLFQTYGLKDVSAGENAFLTSVYTVMVPFLCWAIFKRRPDVYSFIAGSVCILGIGCVSFSNGGAFAVGIGQILTVVCAVFYALQIIIVDEFVKEEGPACLLFLQLAVVGVVCAVGSCIFEFGRTEISMTADALCRLIYLTLIGTLGAQACQMIGQKYVSASHTSILLSFESVFGLLFSVLAGGERLTPVSCIGFFLVFLSVVISETKLRFITKRLKKKTLHVEE